MQGPGRVPRLPAGSQKQHKVTFPPALEQAVQKVAAAEKLTPSAAAVHLMNLGAQQYRIQQRIAARATAAGEAWPPPDLAR